MNGMFIPLIMTPQSLHLQRLKYEFVGNQSQRRIKLIRNHEAVFNIGHENIENTENIENVAVNISFY